MEYIFNEKNLERQRLLAKNLAPFTHRLLSSLFFPAHVRGLDIGCGQGETTRLLARRVGLSNEFTGLDQDGELLGVARQRALDEGLHIDFRQGDATQLPFEDQSFDFVFTRFLLTHIVEPAIVLREMLRVCKIGGIVAVQEPDLITHFSYPYSPAYAVYAEALIKTVPQPMIGRMLGSLFLEAGYAHSHITVESRAEFSETEYRRLDRMGMEALAPTLIARGMMDAQAIEAVCAEMKVVEEAGNSFYMRSHVVSAWVERR